MVLTNGSMADTVADLCWRVFVRKQMPQMFAALPAKELSPFPAVSGQEILFYILFYMIPE